MHSSAQTSPTMMRDGRIRRVSLTRWRKLDLAGALQPDLSGLHRDPVRMIDAQHIQPGTTD